MRFMILICCASLAACDDNGGCEVVVTPDWTSSPEECDQVVVCAEVWADTALGVAAASVSVLVEGEEFGLCDTEAECDALRDAAVSYACSVTDVQFVDVP